VLSTVLFTDIVGSTERATQLGDAAWAAALATHDRLVERHVTAARGIVVKSTGDGVCSRHSTAQRGPSTARVRSATPSEISA
jgi:class 3 adenylate cyclase